MLQSRSINHVLLMVSVIALAAPVRADDLRGKLEEVFGQVLDLQLGGPAGTEHGDHFKPGEVATTAGIITALGNFIGANAASFPLSSTTAGVTFDFSSGVPVAATTSAGPIFAEQATTLGRGTLSLGGTVTHLNLAKLRGVRTKDLRFSFTHEDVGEPGLGDSPNEYDYIDLALNMDIDATVAAFHATYGLTDHLDVGVAIPFVRVKMMTAPWARLNSYTFASRDTANHFFEGGTPWSPVLSFRPDPLNETATGIGDIALRAKLHAYTGPRYDIGLLAEARLATGREEDFLGTGATNVKGVFIASGSWGGINPHANIGYEYRGSDYDRDEIEITLGYDQKATETMTLVVEWTGEFEIGNEIEELQFPGLTPVGAYQSNGQTQAAQYITPTNIPNRHNDNVVNSAFGLKYTPRPNLMLIANVILPLNDGGLRSSWVPTVGLTYSL